MRKIILISITVFLFWGVGCRNKSEEQTNYKNGTKEATPSINRVISFDHDTTSAKSLSSSKKGFHSVETSTTTVTAVVLPKDTNQGVSQRGDMLNILAQEKIGANNLFVKGFNRVGAETHNGYLDPFYYDYLPLDNNYYSNTYFDYYFEDYYFRDFYFGDNYYFDNYYYTNDREENRPTYPTKPECPEPEIRPSERPTPESLKEQIRTSSRPKPESLGGNVNQPHESNKENETEVRKSARPLPQSKENQELEDDQERVNLKPEGEEAQEQEQEQERREAESRRQRAEEERQAKEVEAKRQREEDRKQKEQQEQARKQAAASSSSSSSSSGVRETNRRR